MVDYAHSYDRRERYTAEGWTNATSTTDYWHRSYGCDFFKEEEPKVKVIVEVTVEGKLK